MTASESAPVTLADLYYKMGVVEGKVDSSLRRMNSFEPRLRKLENARSWLVGAVAVIAVCSQAAVGWVKGKIC